MRRGFKTWAEKLALEQRRILNLQDTAALPARLLGDHLDITIISPDEIPGIPASTLQHLQYADPDSWSATTFTRNGCTVIIYNKTHSRRRQESDIMHELAHVICNHKPSQLVKLDNFPFPLRSYNADDEDEASWLGGCLQVPRTALLWAIRRGMNEQMMVEYFNASSDLIRYRRQITAVDRQVARRHR